MVYFLFHKLLIIASVISSYSSDFLFRYFWSSVGFDIKNDSTIIPPALIKPSLLCCPLFSAFQPLAEPLTGISSILLIAAHIFWLKTLSFCCAKTSTPPAAGFEKEFKWNSIAMSAFLATWIASLNFKFTCPSPSVNTLYPFDLKRFAISFLKSADITASLYRPLTAPGSWLLCPAVIAIVFLGFIILIGKPNFSATQGPTIPDGNTPKEVWYSLRAFSVPEPNSSSILSL